MWKSLKTWGIRYHIYVDIFALVIGRKSWVSGLWFSARDPTGIYMSFIFPYFSIYLPWSFQNCVRLYHLCRHLRGVPPKHRCQGFSTPADLHNDKAAQQQEVVLYDFKWSGDTNFLHAKSADPSRQQGGQRRGARHKRPWGQHSTLARAHAPKPGSYIWSSFLLQKAMLGTGASRRSTWSVLQRLQGKPLRGTSFPNLAPTSKPNLKSESDVRHWSLPAEHLVRPSGAWG